MTPYRSAGPVDTRIADPARARLGLVLASAGAVGCFVALARSYLAPFDRADQLLLMLGAALLVVGVAYSALDAPAGRAAMLTASFVLGASFVAAGPLAPAAWRHSMGASVWPARYLALSGVAVGLLLRLRRSRPGTSGALLRITALLAAWWGVQWFVASAFTDGARSARAEALSRASYLLLAVGMLDVRRYVGIAPRAEPARTADDALRELQTTRLCAAMVSLVVALAAQRSTWHAEWTVIACCELVVLAVTVAAHAPSLARLAPPGAARRLLAVGVVVAVPAVAAGAIAFDAQRIAPMATALVAVVALAFDEVARRLATTTAIRRRMALAMAARVAWVLVVVVRTRAGG